MRPKLRVAVIGSGAAALGVLHAVFKQSPNTEITLFDIARTSPHPPNHIHDAGPLQVQNFYSDLYVQLKSEHGLRFPPMKSHFGNSLDRYSIERTKRFFVSDRFGGLTQFWGATLLPFLESDMSGWPITQAELHPYYKEMADFVGISGRSDQLNQCFSPEYITRPPVQVLEGLKHLDEVVNRNPSKGPYQVVSGLNRVALETRAEEKKSCVYCGECMAGCYRGSVFSTEDAIGSWIREKKLNLISRKVSRILPTSTFDMTSVETVQNGEREIHSGFDRIFLCAGAVGSAEILMRSFDIRNGPTLSDNAIFQLPVLNLGRASGSMNRDQYLSLSNLIFSFLPEAPKQFSAQAQIYPNFDYLWRNAIPEWLWPAARRPISWLRDRLLWARFYLHSQYCYKYALELGSDDQLRFRLLQTPDSTQIEPVIQSLRSSLRGSPFVIPCLKPVVSKTSSHLAGSFPFHDPLLNIGRNGEVRPGLFLCDSSLFPDSPATSLTFTIMANANRIATEAIGTSLNTYGVRQ